MASAAADPHLLPRRPAAPAASAPTGLLRMQCLCPMAHCSYSICAPAASLAHQLVYVGTLVDRTAQMLVLRTTSVLLLLLLIHCLHPLTCLSCGLSTPIARAFYPHLQLVQLIRACSSCGSSAPATRAVYPCLQLVFSHPHLVSN